MTIKDIKVIRDSCVMLYEIRVESIDGNTFLDNKIIENEEIYNFEPRIDKTFKYPYLLVRLNRTSADILDDVEANDLIEKLEEEKEEE